MKCKINSGDKSKLTRTSSTRAIKSNISSRSSASHSTNFKIKLNHGLSPNRSSSIHGCRTQTRSSVSSTASTSKGKGDAKNDTNRAVIRDKEIKKPKESDHKCKCVCASCGLSINDAGSNDRDVSMIREPINLGTKNVRQILQCVHNGTPEIKDIVLNECNIIYECRVCRNLFRSLANLLSHKRFYCKEHQCENMLLFDNKNWISSDDIMIYDKNIIDPESKPKTEQNERYFDYKRPVNDSLSKATTIGEHRQALNLLDCENPNPHRNLSTDAVTPSENIQEKLVAKRKHLELCVSKLLTEKQSSTSESLVHLTEISTTKNAVNQIYEEELKESMSASNVYTSHSSNQDGEFPDKEIEQSSSSVPDSQLIKESIKEKKPTVRNIDENANHPVVCEEQRPNMQKTSNYAHSISSLVSDECSKESGILKSESISEIENESMDVGDISSNKELSQQSIPSSSSSNHSQSRKYSPIRNKPKTFNDEYETKSSSIATVPCSMCNSKFSSKKTLTVHIQTIHNVQRLIYPCPFCCLTFKQLFNATRHMIQVHRKGKTQVKYLREAVKRRAYPEIKSDFIDGSESNHADSSGDAYEDEDGDGDDASENENDEKICDLIDDSVEPASPLVPSKVGISSKRKTTDSVKEEYESETEVSSAETNHHENANWTEQVSVQKSNISTPAIDKDTKEDMSQAKVRRVNPIIFSCINNCGEYFIKVDSKNQHEKKCSRSSQVVILDDPVNPTQPNQTAILNPSNENIDFNIPDSVYKELEKVGNLTTLRCNNCPTLHFDSKSSLINHLILHKGYEILKCKKCAYQTLDRTEMDNHLSSEHDAPEILRENYMVKLSNPFNNDSNDSLTKKQSNQSIKEDINESKTSEKSVSSGIVLHLRPKLSRNRKKKKIYEIVGD